MEGVKSFQSTKLVPQIKQPNGSGFLGKISTPKKNGWFQETARHSNAAKFGKAGGLYAEKKKTATQKVLGFLKKEAGAVVGGAEALGAGLLKRAQKAIFIEDPKKLQAEITQIQFGQKKLALHVQELEEQKKEWQDMHNTDMIKATNEKIFSAKKYVVKLDEKIDELTIRKNEAEERRKKREAAIASAKKFGKEVAFETAKSAGEGYGEVTGTERKAEEEEYGEVEEGQEEIEKEKEKIYEEDVFNTEKLERMSDVGQHARKIEEEARQIEEELMPYERPAPKPRTRMEADVLDYYDATKAEDVESAFPFEEELEAAEAEGSVFSRLMNADKVKPNPKKPRTIITEFDEPETEGERNER